jgi:hypothetical protein
MADSAGNVLTAESIPPNGAGRLPGPRGMKIDFGYAAVPGPENRQTWGTWVALPPPFRKERGKILSCQSSNFSHGTGAERTSMSFLGMRKSINPMEAWAKLGAATQSSPLPGLIGLDEFPAGYSLAGCSPAEPASASPTGDHPHPPEAAVQGFFRERQVLQPAQVGGTSGSRHSQCLRGTCRRWRAASYGRQR